MHTTAHGMKTEDLLPTFHTFILREVNISTEKSVLSPLTQLLSLCFTLLTFFVLSQYKIRLARYIFFEPFGYTNNL